MSENRIQGWECPTSNSRWRDYGINSRKEQEGGQWTLALATPTTNWSIRFCRRRQTKTVMSRVSLTGLTRVCRGLRRDWGQKNQRYRGCDQNSEISQITSRRQLNAARKIPATQPDRCSTRCRTSTP